MLYVILLLLIFLHVFNCTCISLNSLADEDRTHRQRRLLPAVTVWRKYHQEPTSTSDPLSVDPPSEDTVSKCQPGCCWWIFQLGLLCRVFQVWYESHVSAHLHPGQVTTGISPDSQGPGPLIHVCWFFIFGRWRFSVSIRYTKGNEVIIPLLPPRNCL